MHRFSRKSIGIVLILLAGLLDVSAATPSKRDIRFRKSVQEFQPAYTNRIALADVDGDGDLDMATANFFNLRSKIWLNDGKGKFSDSGQELTDFGHGAAFADIDGDGDPDLLIAGGRGSFDGKTRHSRNTRLYLNDGKGKFSDSGQDFGDRELSCVNAEFADVNGDGAADVLLTFYDAGNPPPNAVFLNDGTGHFGKSPMTFPAGALFADFNGDGKQDMLFRQEGSAYILKMNDGGGSFDEYWRYENKQAVRGTFHAVDIDRDGDLDFLATNDNGRIKTPTRIFINDGKGKFALSEASLDPAFMGRIASGDLNGDAYPDIVLQGIRQPASFWLNIDGKRFQKSAFTVDIKGLVSQVCVADIDKDGDPDLLFSNFRGGPNAIYFNLLKK